jgi:3-methylcrotonyl-CoA carboxylase alpha subunit
VRLDSGVEQGDEVSVFYDPMLAKLIVRGADRPLALRAMQRALAGWESSGLPTNVPFLRRVCGSEAFSAGHVHTAFIDDHKAELLPASPPAPHSSLLFLSALHWLGARSLALATALPPGSPVASSAFTSLGGSVCGGASASPLELQPLGPDGRAVGEPRRVQVRRLGAAEEGPPAWEMRDADEGGEWTSVRLGTWEEGSRHFRATVGGRSVQGSALLLPTEAGGEETSVTVWAGGEVASVVVRDALQQAIHTSAATAAMAGGGTKQGAVLSPMPGKLVKLLVEAGQAVKAGEPLLVLEAMKMEHTLRATADAVVERTFGREGDVVPQRAVLVSFEVASS